MGLIAGGSSPVSLAGNSARTASAGGDNQQKAKLSLSTDFANPAHWDRVIEFASKHEVSRLVYWGFDSFDSRGVFLYPRRPKLLPEQSRVQVERERGLLRSAAAKTTRAGMEFWYVFPVLQLPVVGTDSKPPTLDHARQAAPDLFNKDGEPDMASDKIYEYLGNQISELRELAPQLSGIELWCVEGAAVEVASLQRQGLSTPAICARIVDTAHACLAHTSIRLDVDLHTPGGDPVTRKGLLNAAKRHRDVIVSADNVIGDFNLFLPFHMDLVEAAKTNPIAVHFDLNGEYWGRNFVPTSALDQYVAHIEEARRLGAVYLDGRVATVHNVWSPHANVLPSRLKFYPKIAGISAAAPLPPDLFIPSTDTLGCFNAEFFCRRGKDPQTQARDVLVDFLSREFGEHAKSMVPAFLRLQHTLGNLFFADTNYYGFQSILPSSSLMGLGYLSDQLILPEGTEFPTPELRKMISGKGGYHFAFAGWPTPLGHLCAGTSAIIFDKQAGLEEAQEILGEVRKAAQDLESTDRDFLVRQFEDLVCMARARRYLIEAQVHYYLLKQGKRVDEFPDRSRLEQLRESLEAIMHEWETRYPGGRYQVAEQLKDWLGNLSSL
jgi:hypothetical protein